MHFPQPDLAATPLSVFRLTDVAGNVMHDIIA